MEPNKLMMLKERFDAVARIIEGAQTEYWRARDIQELLGYARWENFIEAIKRAVVSCEATGFAVEDHFRETTKLIEVGKGAKRPVPDYLLTRYA